MALEGGLLRARRVGWRKDFEMLAGGVAGWCVLRGSEVAACFEEAVVGKVE